MGKGLGVSRRPLIAPAVFGQVVALAKRRGFVFASSEIYGGAGAAWDWGPVGVLFKNNVKRAWWLDVVQRRRDVVGLDAAILMHPEVWRASGHVDNFVDPLVDCRACKHRFRLDTLKGGADLEARFRRGESVDLTSTACPDCGQREFTAPRQFNLMFKTHVGPVEDSAAVAWLRPETAQGIYVNFHNVVDSAFRRIPFGIAQIGKAFRNEITPGNFVFRSREFEQMEMQYFVRPGESAAVFERWLTERRAWYARLGLAPELISEHEHGPGELAHYAARAVDLRFSFPFGESELEGIHDRGDYDLTRHAERSGKDLRYIDQVTGERYIPHIVETSVGADRAALAFLCAAYTEEATPGGRRTVLRLHPRLAPYAAAVLPLQDTPEMTALAERIHDELSETWSVAFDRTQHIGRRYRRQDEIGTPFCVTIDPGSLQDGAVTVRERDSMAQIRISSDELVGYLRASAHGATYQTPDPGRE